MNDRVALISISCAWNAVKHSVICSIIASFSSSGVCDRGSTIDSQTSEPSMAVAFSAIVALTRRYTRPISSCPGSSIAENILMETLQVSAWLFGFLGCTYTTYLPWNCSARLHTD